MSNKKVLRSTIIGFVLLLLSLAITAVIFLTDLANGGHGTLYGRDFTYGLRASVDYYFLLWRPSQIVHETAYIGQVLILVAIVLTLVLLIMSFAKKKPICIFPLLRRCYCLFTIHFPPRCANGAIRCVKSNPGGFNVWSNWVNAFCYLF